MSDNKNGLGEIRYLISILKALLKDEQPPEPPEGCDLGIVFKLAQAHSVAGMAYYAIEKLDIPPEGEFAAAWRQVRDKAIVKDITQLSELESIGAAFSSAGIRYLPLKGSIIKHYYPQSDMRTMADIDMLIDPENVGKARDIMLSLGYSCEHFGYDVHDIYHKPPVMNVEIHRELFGEEGQEFKGVFGSPWELCERDGMRFRFRDNEFFAYVLAHAIKHLEEGGTGIRTVMDLWVCLDSNKNIDAEKALALLESSGKRSAAERLIALSRVWFGDAPHTDETMALQRYILGSGTYGTVTNSAQNRIKTSGRAGYFFQLIFPTFTHMRQHYPILKKAPVLLPACWFVRLVTKPFINRRQNSEKLRQILKK